MIQHTVLSVREKNVLIFVLHSVRCDCRQRAARLWQNQPVATCLCSARSRRSSRATGTLNLGAAACNEPSRAGMPAGACGSISEVSSASHCGCALSASADLEPAELCRSSVTQVRVPGQPHRAAHRRWVAHLGEPQQNQK